MEFGGILKTGEDQMKGCKQEGKFEENVVRPRLVSWRACGNYFPSSTQSQKAFVTNMLSLQVVRGAAQVSYVHFMSSLLVSNATIVIQPSETWRSKYPCSASNTQLKASTSSCRSH